MTNTMTQTTMETKTLTKAQRRTLQLDRHYKQCFELGKFCGLPTPDGKKISIALMKLEKLAHGGATAHCNGEIFHALELHDSFNFPGDETAWEKFSLAIKGMLSKILSSIPPGFFVNGDARGYALKIDSEDKLPIEMHQDWGGYQILSPTITGESI